jgi:hypothetical protein
MKKNIDKLFNLVGDRVKWIVFIAMIGIMIAVGGEAFKRVWKTQDALALEHREFVGKEQFDDFRQEARKSFDKLERLIMDINK